MSKSEQILKKWYNPLHGIGDIAEIQITEAMKEYAMECLKKASDNAKIEKNGNSGSWYDAGINKQSIHNENNLV